MSIMPRRSLVTKHSWSDEEDAHLASYVHTAKGGENTSKIPLEWREIADKMNGAAKEGKLSNNDGRVYTISKVMNRWNVFLRKTGELARKLRTGA
jgi:hypothetical protein